MPYDPERHHRRSIRLRGYDYTQPGYYFITICTHARQPLFSDPNMRAIAEEQWQALGRAGARGARPGRVSVDIAVVLPDHTHAIIVIASGPAGCEPAAPPADRDAVSPENTLGINVAPGSLGAVVRSYKAAVARRANRQRRTPAGDVWQRGYYERIIRDPAGLAHVRRYIATNPARHARSAAQLDALLARMDLRL